MLMDDLQGARFVQCPPGHLHLRAQGHRHWREEREVCDAYQEWEEDRYYSEKYPNAASGAQRASQMEEHGRQDKIANLHWCRKKT